MLSKEEYEEGVDENELQSKQPIVFKKDQSDLQPIQPENVPTDIRVVINSTIATANIEGQVESQRIRDFILEFKEKYPDNSLKCKETIEFAIEGEQTNSLLGHILGKTPDARFSITKTYTPDYEVE